MAATVKKRTCFYSIVNGTIRPHEWCMTVMSDGKTYVEHFWPFRRAERTPFTQNNFSDSNEFQMVNEFLQVDDNKLSQMLSGDQTPPLHGGNTLRTGV